MNEVKLAHEIANDLEWALSHLVQIIDYHTPARHRRILSEAKGRLRDFRKVINIIRCCETELREENKRLQAEMRRLQASEKKLSAEVERLRHKSTTYAARIKEERG